MVNYGTGRFIGGTAPLDASRQQYLNNLSGVMGRTGAGIGATGGLTYDSYANGPNLVSGPTAAATSGQFLQTPEQAGGQPTPVAAGHPLNVAPVQPAALATQAAANLSTQTPAVPYATTPLPAGTTPAPGGAAGQYWTQSGGWPVLTQAGAQHEASLRPPDTTEPMLQGVPLSQILGTAPSTLNPMQQAYGTGVPGHPLGAAPLPLTRTRG